MDDIHAVPNLNTIKPERIFLEKNRNVNKSPDPVKRVQDSDDTNHILDPGPSENEIEKEIDKEKEVSEGLTQAENLLSALNNKLIFVADERSRTGLVVQIVDSETGETVKQLPPEELLEMVARLKEAVPGIFIDDNV